MDLQQPPKELADHLHVANACRNDTWQMWKYIAHGQKVVLCGYCEPFNVSGFLVFYGSTHIRLPVWLEKAKFSLKVDVAPTMDIVVPQPCTEMLKSSS